MITTPVLSFEAHLIRRAQQGDLDAFERLCDTYRPTLRQLAMRMLRNADDANDVVQDTFLKAYRGLADFDPTRPLKPWLCRICTNCCIDAVRDRRKGGESIDQHEYMLVDERADAEAHAHETFESELVVGAVHRLPEKYRTIIAMRHYQHMEVNEIASALDKPEGTIKSWLFRARAMLRKDLQPEFASAA